MSRLTPQKRRTIAIMSQYGGMLPDATVNNSFKYEWSRQDVHKLCQVQRCCERVADSLNARNVCAAYVRGFPAMCAAIREQEGGKSKFIP